MNGSIAYVPQQAWMQNASLRFLERKYTVTAYKKAAESKVERRNDPLLTADGNL